MILINFYFSVKARGVAQIEKITNKQLHKCFKKFFTAARKRGGFCKTACFESLGRLLLMNRNVCQIGPSCPAFFGAKTTILSSLDEQEQNIDIYFKEYLFIL